MKKKFASPVILPYFTSSIAAAAAAAAAAVAAAAVVTGADRHAEREGEDAKGAREEGEGSPAVGHGPQDRQDGSEDPAGRGRKRRDGGGVGAETERRGGTAPRPRSYGQGSSRSSP